MIASKEAAELELEMRGMAESQAEDLFSAELEVRRTRAWPAPCF